ncbi:MAG: carbon dioxide concentrating mechanism protein CcmL, partial [Elusimicrobia bacterium]|nr:carbon dioxide concentrating mechanism protein CcmL [Elusimicrobiota bacterium]
TEGNPVDCTIFAVVDTIEKGRETIFSKRDDFTKK